MQAFKKFSDSKLVWYQKQFTSSWEHATFFLVWYCTTLFIQCMDYAITCFSIDMLAKLKYFKHLFVSLYFYYDFIFINLYNDVYIFTFSCSSLDVLNGMDAICGKNVICINTNFLVNTHINTLSFPWKVNTSKPRWTNMLFCRYSTSIHLFPLLFNACT